MFEPNLNDPVDEAYDLYDLNPLNPRVQGYLVERWRQKHLLILRIRRIRDLHDPYDVTFETFTKSYRLSQDLAFSLLRLIRPFIRTTTSPRALPLEVKVNFYTVNFYSRHFFFVGQ